MKTPQQSHPQLATTLGLQGELYLKREDLHPYGSHKGRSIPIMIREYHKQATRNFVISSSGNAALAAIHTIIQHNKNKPDDLLTLHVFVGKKIAPTKLQALSEHAYYDPHIRIESVERPKQAAFALEKNNEATYLRQSTDDLALIGYAELANELNKIPNLSAIFIPTSSGTTAQSLAEAFATLEQKPQIHIVQTDACHPIAEMFDTPKKIRDTSIAGAIVDNVAHRKDKVVAAIKKASGSGWIVTDKEIQNAIVLTKQTTGINISPNSALSIAGLQRARTKNQQWTGAVICLITGE